MNNNDIKEVVKNLKKYSVVMQDGIKDCGVASLLMIIRYYNGDAPKEYLRDLTGTTKEGVNALSLIEAGRKIGFETRGVHGDVINIEKRFLPCIAHVVIDNKYKHFVVIYEVNKKNNYVLIADPGRGLVKMSIESFKNISTNNYLFFRYIKKIPTIKAQNQIYINLITVISDNLNIVLLVTFLSILFILTSIVVSHNMEFIIDKSLNFHSKQNLNIIIILMILIYSLKLITEFFRNKLLNFINHKIDYSIITTSFYHVLSLPYLYYKNRTTGEVITRLNDLSDIKELISNLIVTLFADLLLLIVVLFFLFKMNTSFTLVIILITFFYILIKIVINHLLSNKLKEVKENNSSESAFAIELVSGINTVRSLNNLEKMITKFSLKYNKLLSSSYSYTNLLNVENLVSTLFFNIIFLYTLFRGSYEVLNDTFALSKLITYTSLLTYYFNPIKNILNLNFMYKKVKIVIDRINELLSLEEEKTYMDTSSISLLDGSISIKNLSYSYDNRNYLIKNFNLDVKSGEKVVICAPSGYGKSTLAKLLVRYLDVPKNMIYIDSKDINDYNLWTLRENITYVSQDELLFTDSILNNLIIKNTCDDERIEKVCKETLVDEIISTRNADYNMLLEENGSNISGGERQRVILARALLKESKIYIFDESFSEIDVERERTIVNNIKNDYKDKTFIVISHRYDNNDLYDKVIKLREENGY